MATLILSVDGQVLKEYTLSKERTLIGRKAHNDIQIDKLAVSGEHAAIITILNDSFIEDLGSTNGTYINGKMVKRQKLVDGETVAIGNFRIRYLTESERPSGFSETTAMKLESGPVPVARHAVFQVLNGSSMGLEVPVVKAVSTFGKPGVSVVAVSHRRDGYFAAHLDGPSAPTLNGDAIGADAVLLSNHDVLELAGTRMLFLLKE
jgi:hypothetical protein